MLRILNTTSQFYCAARSNSSFNITKITSYCSTLIALAKRIRHFLFAFENKRIVILTSLLLGFTTVHRCSFCKLEPQTLKHLLFYCTHSKRYWKDCESYFYSHLYRIARCAASYYNLHLPPTRFLLINC